MSYRQIVLETNIDWQGTLDRIMERRKKEKANVLIDIFAKVFLFGLQEKGI
jgi:hypothetical protein